MMKTLRIVCFVFAVIVLPLAAGWIIADPTSAWREGWAVVKSPNGFFEGMVFVAISTAIFLVLLHRFLRWLDEEIRAEPTFVVVPFTLIFFAVAYMFVGKPAATKLPTNQPGEFRFALIHHGRVIHPSFGQFGWATASRAVEYPADRELTLSYPVGQRLLKATLHYGCPPDDHWIGYWYRTCRLRGISDEEFVSWHAGRLISDNLSAIAAEGSDEKIASVTKQIQSQLQDSLRRIGLKVRSLKLETIHDPLGGPLRAGSKP